MSDLSLAVTAFEEMSERRGYGQHLLDCITPGQQHPSISEIIVVDDCSYDYEELERLLGNQPKVQLYRNERNLGVFGNKLEAVARCVNDWVINCDSDNTKNAEHIDKVAEICKAPSAWYCPSFARPQFDYRKLVGEFDMRTIRAIRYSRIFPCFMNTGNQVVHRGKFMEVFGKYRGERADLMMTNWLGTPEKDRQTHYWRMVFDANDSLVFNLEWLKAGGKLCVVEGLEYDHRYATGDSGNYTRSPCEKAALGEILLKELDRYAAEAATRE